LKQCKIGGAVSASQLLFSGTVVLAAMGARPKQNENDVVTYMAVKVRLSQVSAAMIQSLGHRSARRRCDAQSLIRDGASLVSNNAASRANSSKSASSDSLAWEARPRAEV